MLFLDSFKERLISIAILKRLKAFAKRRLSFILSNITKLKKNLENKKKFVSRSSKRKYRKRFRLNSRLSSRSKMRLNYLSKKVRIRVFLILRLMSLKKMMDLLRVKLCLIKEMGLKLSLIFGLRLLMKLLLKYL